MSALYALCVCLHGPPSPPPPAAFPFFCLSSATLRQLQQLNDRVQVGQPFPPPPQSPALARQPLARSATQPIIIIIIASSIDVKAKSLAELPFTDLLFFPSPLSQPFNASDEQRRRRLGPSFVVIPLGLLILLPLLFRTPSGDQPPSARSRSRRPVVDTGLETQSRDADRSRGVSLCSGRGGGRRRVASSTALTLTLLCSYPSLSVPNTYHTYIQQHDCTARSILHKGRERHGLDLSACKVDRGKKGEGDLELQHCHAALTRIPPG